MGGIFTYQQLRAAGYSRRAIDRLVGAGALSRFARGWFADHSADQSEVRAIATGAESHAFPRVAYFPCGYHR